MADVMPAAWWRRTAWLAAVVIFLWGFFGVLLQFFYAGRPGIAVFGFPLGYFLAAIVAPIVLAIILFSFVARQRVIDRRHGGGEA